MACFEGSQMAGIESASLNLAESDRDCLLMSPGLTSYLDHRAGYRTHQGHPLIQVP